MPIRGARQNKSGQKPISGINTSGRSSTKGGENKRKKDGVVKFEKNREMSKAQKEKEAEDKKRDTEKKLIEKRNAREAARLLDIEYGLLAKEDTEAEKEEVHNGNGEKENTSESADTPEVQEVLLDDENEANSTLNHVFCIDER